MSRRESDVSGSPHNETELPSEPSEADKLWSDLEGLTSPTSEQMDLFLEKFLALAPGEADWYDLFHFFSSRHHKDLPSVFRRMAGVIPNTKEEGTSFLYWAAAEEFDRLGHRDLLPEVAAAYRKLDGQSYDADALSYLEDYLLAAGFDAETLELDEHFLPVLREDGNLMPHVIPDVANKYLNYGWVQSFATASTRPCPWRTFRNPYAAASKKRFMKMRQRTRRRSSGKRCRNSGCE
jgi:hypothetical protein